MENNLKKQISEAAESYMAKHNMSQADLAKNSGVNAAYLIAMQKGEFSITSADGKTTTNISDKWFLKLADCIGFEVEKNYWETRATPQLIRMLAALEDAKKYGYTRLLIGETGCGKSFVLDRFWRVNPHDTFIVVVGSSDNIGDLIDKVLDALKLPYLKTKSQKLRSISAKMKEMSLRGYSPTICFDECEFMKQPALCAMKELHDALNEYCSIIMSGTEQFLRNIEILRKKNKPGIPQFWRRIKFGVIVLPEIDRKFDDFLNGVEPGLKTFLRANCDNYGELHDVMVPALREAERLGEPLTESLVRKMLNMPEQKANVH